MIYLIEWICSWLFLGKAPHRHTYGKWSITHNSIMAVKSEYRTKYYGQITVSQICRECGNANKIEHETELMVDEKSAVTISNMLEKSLKQSLGIE